MFKQVWHAIRSAFGGLVARPAAVSVTFLLYLLLIGLVWVFVTTREATILDLLITLVAALVAVGLFFILQAIAIRQSDGGSMRTILARSLRDSWKFLIASLPVILLGIGAFLAADPLTPDSYEPGTFFSRTLLPALKVIVFWLILPLLAIRLWIVTAQSGLRAAYSRLGRVFVGTFAPKQLLTFAIIALLSGVTSYLLIFKKTSIDREWAEITLLSARLLLANVVIFLGWFLGVGALSELNKA